MPDTIEAFKRKTRKQLFIVIAFLAVMIVVGLYAVQERSKDYAANAAKQVAIDQIQAENYQINFTTCGVRALVTPGLTAQKKTLERAKESAADTTQSKSVRSRAKSAIISTQKSINSTNKVLAVFGTIPPGFDCKTLPKHPPR